MSEMMGCTVSLFLLLIVALQWRESGIFSSVIWVQDHLDQYSRRNKGFKDRLKFPFGESLHMAVFQCQRSKPT